MSKTLNPYFRIMQFLSLSPDVHIWKSQKQVLLYNAAKKSQDCFQFNSELEESLIDGLLDIRNLYCVPLSERQRNLSIVNRIVSGQFGEIVTCTYDNRPLTIPPLHLLENRFDSGTEMYSVHVLDFVQALSIHLEDRCDRACSNCEFLFKQTHSCTISKNPIMGINAHQIVSKIYKLKNLLKINILITSVDKPVLETIRALTFPGILFCYHINWKNISSDIVASLLEVNNSALIKILVDISNVSTSQLEQIFQLQAAFKESIILVVCVSSEADYERIQYFVDEDDNNIEFHPIWTGENNEFLRDNYLLHEVDLHNLSADHNRIFGNRELNFSLFGELVIHPDGTVRLNENTDVIGTIEDDWTDMLNKALNKPNPWLMTRNKIEPCSYCIYRDLCPPIRNLELYMGDKLACVDYYKSLVKPEKDNN